MQLIFLGALFYIGLPKKAALFTPDFEKSVVLLTPALIGIRLIFKTGGIRVGIKGAGVKKGSAEKGPIMYSFCGRVYFRRASENQKM